MKFANLLIIMMFVMLVVQVESKNPTSIPDCAKNDSSDFCKADKLVDSNIKNNQANEEYPTDV